MLDYGATIPFVDELGITLHVMEDGKAVLHYTPRDEHLNSFGIIHGGALMTLLDVTMASAARSLDPSKGALTIEMKTSFMQAARGPVVAHGRLLHHTRSLMFAEASVFDAQGLLCCQASGTFKLAERRGQSAAVSP